MKKKTCWEFKNCGREPGGRKAEELGVCLVAASKGSSSNNGNGCGKCCTQAGTFCGGEIQGSYAKKLGTCFRCDYFDKTQMALFVE